VDRYQQEHSFVWKYGTSLIDLVFNELAKDDDILDKNVTTILDIGCGSGELTAQLAERDGGQQNVHITGIDADRQMIQAATRQFPHVTFVQADARTFDFGESVFDVVFSNAALHWIPSDDIDQVIACISRALKPGGKLVVEFGGKGNIQRIESAIQQTTNITSTWYFPTVADFTTRLEEMGGIETTMARLYDRPTVLQGGKEGMKNWLYMFGQHFWHEIESKDNLDKVLSEIETELEPALFDGDNWVADYRRICVVGQKCEPSVSTCDS
jgi:ubiquinone/menaquinone biosynthesis C-methylase UbiE